MSQLKIKNIGAGKKNIEKYRINKEKFIYNQKNKLNENGFDLWTKILTKIKIRDQRKLIKIFIGGNWRPFSREAVYPGAIFLGETILQETIF